MYYSKRYAGRGIRGATPCSAQLQDTGGNIYYVRLKTPVGPLNKIGFTTLSSVHDRLAYKAEDMTNWYDEVPSRLCLMRTLCSSN